MFGKYKTPAALKESKWEAYVVVLHNQAHKVTICLRFNLIIKPSSLKHEVELQLLAIVDYYSGHP